MMRTLLTLLMIALPGVSLGLPNQFVQEGLVLDRNGAPLAGPHTITLRLYAGAAGGAPLFEETHQQVQLFEGYYAVQVGSIRALDAALFARPELHMGISIDGGAELAPRTPLTKVPAAFVADVATNVTGNITPRTVSVGGNVVINENGQWVGNPAGLQGPPGPPGPAGQVDVDQLIQAMLANPARLPWLFKDRNDTATNATYTFNSSRINFSFGAPANALSLGNNNIVGVNALNFNDPGFNEGIVWDGSQARIAVAPLAGGDGDGWLRIINDDGISLESNTRIAGNLTITGVIDAVQAITATVINATTANITNANITTLNGPNNRVNVIGELNLLGDVRLAPDTDFIGVLRSEGLITGGDIQARNIRAAGSMIAAGNIEAGGLLRAGAQGIWVQNIQVFDGNGNLLRRPIYQCPAGQVMMGTDGNGLPRCANLICPVGQYFRGVDANGNPACAADEGLRAIPAQNCPAGQAVVRLDANGAATCGVPRADPQTCPAGQFMTGLNANGSVICAQAPAGGGGQAGQCAANQVRPNIFVCTNSSRSVATFVPAGFNFNIVVGRCDPDATVQAMFVARSGGGQAAGRAAQWQQYVTNGGLIISEYNVSDEVFNAVFGGGIGQGARQGPCQDNAMPVVKNNVNDPFWAANGALNVTPAANGPCGHQIDHFPGVTMLGGWSANQNWFGYRNLGSGRVWFVDADWQDNENFWRPDSSAFMGKLMTWCGAAGGGGNALVFQGVRNNVPNGDVVGWQECHRSFYNANTPMANILNACNGDQIMYGCQRNGAAAWQVLAQGPRDVVFRDTGNGNNPSVANGVGWYFSQNWSLGFAPEGQAISRNSCDTQNGLADQRICWHSGGNAMNGGWRCGANTGLNGDAGWTRVIWTRNGAGGGGGQQIRLGLNVGFGHHGACNSWNGCGNAQNCANAICRLRHGVDAVSFQSGGCMDLKNQIPGGMHCSLFSQLPNNLDAGWGGGCNVPVAYDVVCAAPAGGGGGLQFAGVRENVPDAQVVGWRQCHNSLYGQSIAGLNAIVAGCAGNRVMYGCRPSGAANWTLLAQGARASVFRDTGNGNATTRDNGVEWYFSNNWSLGFAPEGNGVSRNSCDTQGGNGHLRMCWHSSGDRITSGYRCGNSFLNGNNGWERRIWVQ